MKFKRKFERRIDSYNTIEPTRRWELLPMWFKIIIILTLIFPIYVTYMYLFSGNNTNVITQIDFRYGFIMIAFNSLLWFLRIFVAYSLWTERDWAVRLGIFDGLINLILLLLSVYIIIGNANQGLN